MSDLSVNALAFQRYTPPDQSLGETPSEAERQAFESILNGSNPDGREAAQRKLNQTGDMLTPGNTQLAQHVIDPQFAELDDDLPNATSIQNRNFANAGLLGASAFLKLQGDPLQKGAALASLVGTGLGAAQFSKDPALTDTEVASGALDTGFAASNVLGGIRGIVVGDPSAALELSQGLAELGDGLTDVQAFDALSANLSSAVVVASGVRNVLNGKEIQGAVRLSGATIGALAGAQGALKAGTSLAKGALAGIGKVAGPVSLAVGVVTDVIQGNVAGLAGAAVGAIVGSVVPGIGTVLGAVLGQFFGGLFGADSDEKNAAIDKAIRELTASATKVKQESAAAGRAKALELIAAGSREQIAAPDNLVSLTQLKNRVNNFVNTLTVHDVNRNDKDNRPLQVGYWDDSGDRERFRSVSNARSDDDERPLNHVLHGIETASSTASAIMHLDNPKDDEVLQAFRSKWLEIAENTLYDRRDRPRLYGGLTAVGSPEDAYVSSDPNTFTMQEKAHIARTVAQKSDAKGYATSLFTRMGNAAFIAAFNETMRTAPPPKWELDLTNDGIKDVLTIPDGVYQLEVKNAQDQTVYAFTAPDVESIAMVGAAGPATLAYVASDAKRIAELGADPVKGMEHYQSTGKDLEQPVIFVPAEFEKANPDLPDDVKGNDWKLAEYFITTGHAQDLPIRREQFDLNEDGTDDVALSQHVRDEGAPAYSVQDLATGYTFQAATREEAARVLAVGVDRLLKYGASHPDLIASIGNDPAKLLAHYQTHGEPERTLDFNAAAFEVANASVLPADIKGNAHKLTEYYITTGHGQNLPVSEERFDANQSGQADLVLRRYFSADGPHYHAELLADQADGSTKVIGNFSAKTRQDVADVVEAGLENLLSYGASHADLIEQFGNDPVALRRHYESEGAAEGRKVTFSPSAYFLANQPELEAAGLSKDMLSPIAEHYLTTGHASGLPIDRVEADLNNDGRNETIEAFGHTEHRYRLSIPGDEGAAPEEIWADTLDAPTINLPSADGRRITGRGHPLRVGV